MFDPLILALAASAQVEPPPIMGLDPRSGVTPGENRTLSQPHPHATARTFPDLAVKGLRIDGDTLYVRVANQGQARARVPIRVMAHAESEGLRSEATVRTGGLAVGESRWVALRNFAVKSASAGRGASLFALYEASVVSAAVAFAPAMSAAVDRSGQACLPSRGCILEPNKANNSARLEGRAIPRGRP